MIPKNIVFGLAMLFAAPLAANAAASKPARTIDIEASVMTVVDNSLFSSVEGSISKIPGAELAGRFQSVDDKAKRVQIWYLPTSEDSGVVVGKALKPFNVGYRAELGDIVPSGKTFPVAVGIQRDYVSGIDTELDGRGRAVSTQKMAIAEEGLSIKLTPKIGRDGINVDYSLDLAKLVGRDRGFENWKTEYGTIQLKRVGRTEIDSTIAMPSDGRKVIILSGGVSKNEYVVTVLGAKASR